LNVTAPIALPGKGETMDEQTKQILVAILEAQKQQALVSNRILGWFLAVADTLRKNPPFEELLKQHPFYDLGPEPRLQTIEGLIQNIDALIQRLKELP
jgi:hypothetical protein